MEELKDRNRGMILRLLELVEESEDARYVPLLREWAAVDYKKVRQRIGQVIRRLSGEAEPPDTEAGDDAVERPTLKIVP